MRNTARRTERNSLWAIVALWLAGSAWASDAGADEAAVERGAYLARAGGCHACHKADGSGGVKVATPFGALIAPNITPDRDHGIGRWSEAQFVAAMREGRATTGVRYYPGFPYTAYSGLTDADLADLWAYLQAQPPLAVPSQPHALAFPFDQRLSSLAWQVMFFAPEPFAPDPQRSAAWNRGRYLSEHLLHCRECHTPRNALGGLVDSLAYAGNQDWPAGGTVPNITSDPATGIGTWNDNDIVWLLRTGFTPDGNDVQGTMAELIEHGSQHLSEEDLRAVADYILALEPIDHEIRREDETASGSDSYREKDW
ncbi:MAG: c-type cytochrome [Alphaproteobacteria bacterium]|jgi:mono/diheme cytochrome c family protein|nr:c-type cytochrome [Alphaproteobacteria bacterium]